MGGTNNYSSMAHADGILAEGSFTREHFIAFDKGSNEWVPAGDKSVLPPSFCLADANVLPVGADENAKTLWGDLPDPKPALEANGFQMRHVVLTPRRRR